MDDDKAADARAAALDRALRAEETREAARKIREAQEATRQWERDNAAGKND